MQNHGSNRLQTTALACTEQTVVEAASLPPELLLPAKQQSGFANISIDMPFTSYIMVSMFLWDVKQCSGNSANHGQCVKHCLLWANQKPSLGV